MDKIKIKDNKLKATEHIKKAQKHYVWVWID